MTAPGTLNRISSEEIKARRTLMIECGRSQDAATVGQLVMDVTRLRVSLIHLMQAYAGCNGTDHVAYRNAAEAVELTR